MPILHDFDYVRPKSLSEALKVLAKTKGAMVLAGGTDVVGNLKTEMIRPSILVDIKAIKELHKIEIKKDVLIIGALVTYAEILDSKVIRSKFPVYAEIAKNVASVGVRNRATVVGNICSAVPCMDSGPILVAMDATIVVKSTKGTRKVPASKWFVGPRKTALKAGEIVTDIQIPYPGKKHGAAFLKLGRYKGEDLAQASVFVLALPNDKYRIAFGSVGPVPIRGKEVEKILNGHEMSDEIMAKAIEFVRISPITDIRSSKEYREHMIDVMLERGLTAAIERLNGAGPEYGRSLL